MKEASAGNSRQSIPFDAPDLSPSTRKYGKNKDWAEAWQNVS
jgi:hypothetical protein